MIKYKLHQNISWILKKASASLPYLKYWAPLNVFISIIILALTSLLPFFVVWGLQSKINFLKYALIILSICIGLGGFTWLKMILRTRATWENTNLRMQISMENNVNFVKSSFEDAINPKIQKERSKSLNYGYEDDYSGMAELWPNFVMLLTASILIILISLLTVIIYWWYPFIILFFCFLSIVTLIYFNNKNEKLKSKLDNANFLQNYLYSYVFNLESGKDIREFNLADNYKKRINANHKKILLINHQSKALKIKSIIIISVFNFIQLIFAYLPLVHMVTNGKTSLPTFTFIFTLLATLNVQIIKAVSYFSKMINANFNVSIGRKYLDHANKALIPDKKTNQVNDKINLKQIDEIEFKNVSYHYPNSQKLIINHVSFKIKNNQTIALVGLNGAGKTTLISLLMGLLKPSSGDILINHISISDIDLNNYKQLFAPVFQDYTIFADTMINNITIHNHKKISMVNILRKSSLLKDVQSAHLDLNSQLTNYVNDDGINLSGGQNQKLMFARALYKNSKILILDEPTAALDAMAESNMYKQYNSITKNKISIFISHRLASTKFADNIFFLKHGQLICHGSHEHLMATSKDYNKLYQTQSKYYQKDGGEHNEA